MKKPQLARSPTSVDDYIGVQIRKRRIALNMSLATLVQKIGVTPQQVHKYEIGEDRVSAARLFELCDVLKVSLASMFKRSLKA
jgi:transcriptional regulator with XRE-family HTH domain